MNEKIGLFGGTFNPIHLGHLRAAEEIREALGLSKVVFIPAGWPPHRPLDEVIGFEDRYQMVKLATAANPFFEVSDIEGRRPQRSYTVDTIKQLPHKNIDYFFILGMDAFCQIHTWKQPQELLRMVNLVVMPRKGMELLDWQKPLRHIFGDNLSLKDGICQLPTGKCIYFCHILSLNISATQIRQLALQGKSIRYLVPQSVADYIYEKGLYRRGNG